MRVREQRDGPTVGSQQSPLDLTGYQISAKDHWVTPTGVYSGEGREKAGSGKKIDRPTTWLLRALN